MGASYRPDNPFAPKDDSATKTYRADNPFAPPSVRVQSESTRVARPAPTSPEEGRLRYVTGLIASLGQGGLANFGDEITGNVGAGLQSIQDVLTGRGVAHAPRQSMQDFLASRDASTNTSRQKIQNETRQQLAKFSGSHPISSTLAQLVGAVVPAIASGGGTLAGHLGLDGLLGAATEGAAYGAISGAGSGETPTERLTRAITGGALGGALGGTTAAIGKGGGAVVRGIKTLATPKAARAADAADRILAASAASGGGLDALANRGAADLAVGNRPMVATAGGRGVNDLAWLAANTPSGQQGKFVGALEGAKENLRPMLEANLESAADIGPRGAYDATKAIERQQGISANRLYQIAESQPPVNDPQIAHRIMQEPELANAMMRTVHSLGENATPDELKAAQSIAFASNLLQQNPGADVSNLVQPIPVRLLNEMKKGVDDIASNLAAKDQNFTRMDADRIRGAMSDILGRVDQSVPEYAAARGVYKNDADRLASISAGQGMLSKRPEEIADELAGLRNINEERAYPSRLAPQNVPDYRTGGVDALSQALADKAKTKLPNYTGSVLGEGTPMDRVNALLGPEGAAQFAPARESAQRTEATIQRALGGSSTEGNRSVKEAVNEFTPADALQMLEAPRRAVFNLLGKLSSKQKTSFHTALAEELANRLVADPTGDAGRALIQRLQGILDKNSVTAIALRAQRSAQRTRAIGRLGGSLAGQASQ